MAATVTESRVHPPMQCRSRNWSRAGRVRRLTWLPLLAVTALAQGGPDHYRLCFSASGPEKVAACRSALDQGPVEKRLYLELGSALESEKRPGDALALYQEALEDYPDDDELIARLRIVRSNLSEAEWLRSRRETGTTSGPAAGGSDTVQAKLNAIRCRRLSGEAALQACDAALRASPDDAQLHKARGGVLAALGRVAEARLAFQAALRAQPGDEEAQSSLAALGPQPADVESPRRRASAPGSVTSPSGGVADAGQTLPPGDDLVSELTLLRSLREQGLIEGAEFQRRQTALLDARFRTSGAVSSAASTQAQGGPYSRLDFGDYHALVIGNNNYRELPHLETAIGDAQAVGELLENQYGFEVQLLLDATRKDVLRALGGYRRDLWMRDNLLIFYAGHGVLDESAGRGYWLPVDSEQDFKSNWISTADITDALKVIPAGHVLVIADSCYSGSLLRDAGGVLPGAGNQVEVLERLLEKRSRTVLTSGGLEPVMDAGGEGHSVFAKALLDILRENSDVISGDSLFSEVRRKVVLNANQTPEYSDVRLAGHDGGDFIFRRMR